MRARGSVVLALLVGAPSAVAQPAPSEPPAETSPVAPDVAPSASEPASCVPGCRSGYVCISGACVYACNPPCPATHECTGGGSCTLPPPSGRAAAPTDPSVLRQAVKDAVREYDDERRAEYRARTVRRHDGFYLRFGLSAGYALDAAERDEVETDSRGAGGFLEYALGGTIDDQLVIGLSHHTFGV